jgi:hypothetical protein|eukprot:COSAG06_NODE_261_length_18907_cov_6.696353_5_plen_125_part_00
MPHRVWYRMNLTCWSDHPLNDFESRITFAHNQRKNAHAQMTKLHRPLPPAARVRNARCARTTARAADVTQRHPRTLPRSHLHMFRTIHRLLKFFGFGGLRHILIPEAAHVSGHVKRGGWHSSWR